MIQEIKFKNFLSFRDETTFSFVAQNNDNFAEKSQIIQKKDGTRLLRLALVFGYNASGKSNLIEVFNFLGDFWRRKTDDPEKDIFLIPFKLDKVSPHKHSFFETIGTRQQEGISREVVVLQDYATCNAFRTHHKKRQIENKIRNKIGVKPFGS